MKTLASLVLAMVAIHIQAAPAQSITREECAALKKKIDHYQELRKKGGSNASMEAWKKSRRKFEEQYREGRCKRYGKEFW